MVVYFVSGITVSFVNRNNHIGGSPLRKKLLSFTLSLTVALMCSFCLNIRAFATSMPSTKTANLNVIDISHYQGTNITWSSVAQNENAVYIKATEGRTYTDPNANVYANSAKNVGLPFGFYHYFWPYSDLSQTVAEADYFYNFIKNYSYNCVPVLDVEETNGLTRAQITQNVHTFADEFKRLSGLDIMIYTGPYFANDYLDSTLSGYKLWIADYSSAPRDTNIWHQWSMWQYTDSLSVPGIPGAVDGNKATSDIYLGSYASPFAITTIDSPSNVTYYGDITVSGWAVSHAGMSRVDVYVDGNQGIASVTTLTDRPDIQQIINSNGYYPDAEHSGFVCTIGAGTLAAGTHTINVAGIAQDGSVQWSSGSFTIGNPQMSIDSPQDQASLKGNFNITGWAVNANGVGRVDIYADVGMSSQKMLGSVDVSQFSDRPDVHNAVYPNGSYPSGNKCGFSLTVPVSSLTAGTHTLNIAALGNGNGGVQWKVITVTVGPDSITTLDSPASGSTMSGNILVGGWALNHAGVSRIDIYADDCNTYLGTVWANNFFARQDVMNNVGEAKDCVNGLNCGFTFIVPAGTLSAGNHSMKVAAIGYDGSVKWAVNNFTVS